jgi:hypothetical protein
MLRKFLKSAIFGISAVVCLNATSAYAIDLDDATRTVALDGSGKTIVLTPEQVKRGKRLLIHHVELVTLEVLQKQTPM